MSTRLERKIRWAVYKIDDLELSHRAYRCLKEMGIRNLGDLVQHSEAALLRHKDIGRITLSEIRDEVQSLGLRLDMPAPEGWDKVWFPGRHLKQEEKSMSQTPPSEPPAETYIGDGVYASFDGIAIKLRASCLVGDIEVNSNVFLEVNAYAELLRFMIGKTWSRLDD